jgi:hypothetical protein
MDRMSEEDDILGSLSESVGVWRSFAACVFEEITISRSVCGTVADELESAISEIRRLRTAAEKALAYFEACVEPTCDEDDDPEEFHDGSAPEANLLRIALSRPPRGCEG